MSSKPGMIQKLVSHLKLAEKDDEIKAIPLKIDSPGGTVTASDIMYYELMKFKKKTVKKIVVSMMNVAASRGYYISLPADYIFAHPTTITGSIGMKYVGVNFKKLIDKIGVDVITTTSGRNKDMGSMFRNPTKEEEEMVQDMINGYAKRFISLVKKHRHINEKNIKEISTARIFLSDKAFTIGLVDEIDYLNETIIKFQELSGLSKESKVVVFRRKIYPEDNLYNTANSIFQKLNIYLFDYFLPSSVNLFNVGFYYLWAPFEN